VRGYSDWKPAKLMEVSLAVFNSNDSSYYDFCIRVVTLLGYRSVTRGANILQLDRYGNSDRIIVGPVN
jgi:hypothetical protein